MNTYVKHLKIWQVPRYHELGISSINLKNQTILEYELFNVDDKEYETQGYFLASIADNRETYSGSKTECLANAPVWSVEILKRDNPFFSAIKKILTWNSSILL